MRVEKVHCAATKSGWLSLGQSLPLWGLFSLALEVDTDQRLCVQYRVFTTLHAFSCPVLQKSCKGH